MKQLECVGLAARVGHRVLFQNLSFCLLPKETVSILGPNGCGKTTLLKILAGISAPDKGEVFCRQESVWPERAHSHEHRCVYLSYTPGLLLDHSVQWNLEFFLSSFHVPMPEKSKWLAALDQLELGHCLSYPVRTLSSGQKRRLTLAGILLIGPCVVLADEPTNGLDQQGRQLCLDIFDSLKKNHGTSFVFATHDQDLIQWTEKSILLPDHKPCVSSQWDASLLLDL